jgi:hypothetical protein
MVGTFADPQSRRFDGDLQITAGRRGVRHRRPVRAAGVVRFCKVKEWLESSEEI